MAPRLPTFAGFALGCLAAGCSWSRFDDLQNNPPVVLLNRPNKLHAGFGVTMAGAAIDGEDSRVLIGGTSGKVPAATFDLGLGTDPTTDATDTGSCDQANGNCFLAAGVAGIARANVGAADRQKLCFILGIGQGGASAPYGLFGRCADGTEYTLGVPDAVAKNVIQDELILQGDAAIATVRMSTDKDEAAALVAGVLEKKLAWYYPPDKYYSPGKAPPISLIAPGKPEDTYGASSAIVRLGGDAGSRVVAVGAPDAGHVWLFSGADGAPVGCLGGPSHFGRTLASGHVDADDVDDLVIADEAFVTVISGKALAGLAPATNITCSLAALPPDSIIASFGCGTRDTIAGCPGGFGTTLAVGDLDGDGDGEVLVGAPGLSVRGSSGAGAVLVYDAEGKTPEALTDLLFLTSRQAGDGLGSSLVAAHLTGHDVVVAGAPGSARAAIFYCSKILGGAASGSRCQ